MAYRSRIFFTDKQKSEIWGLGLSEAALAAPMALRSTWIASDRSGRKSPFQIHEMVAGRSYSFATILPLRSLIVRGVIKRETPCLFRHEVRFTGPGGWVLSHTIAPGFRQQLPPTMAKLAMLAEQDMAKKR